MSPDRSLEVAADRSTARSEPELNEIFRCSTNSFAYSMRTGAPSIDAFHEHQSTKVVMKVYNNLRLPMGDRLRLRDT